MISALTGILHHLDEDRVQVKVGPMQYELLVPAADVAELQASIGEELTFHTIFNLAGDPSRGGLEPTLIGFLRAEDKKFFDKFTTVKGIGAKTALKALTVPVGLIAEAIESRDARFLVQLDGIGKRTAELMIAELAGKVGQFALPTTAKMRPVSSARRTAEEQDAIAALIQLGERRIDAEHFVERARQANPDLKTSDALLRESLRLRTARV